MNSKLVSSDLKERLQLIIPWTLAVVVALVIGFALITAISNNSETNYWGAYLLFGILTTTALYFGVMLTEGELSVAHTIGMVAFLSMPVYAFPGMTLAIFVGGIFGVIALQFRGRVHPLMRQQIVGIRSGVFILARLVLSFWVAGTLYLAALGPLPLGQLGNNLGTTFLPLLLYAFTFTVLYLSIFLLESYVAGIHIRNLIENDIARIAVILFLPIPFAILGADILAQLSTPSRVIFVAGIVFIILSLYALSVSEFQLRKQLHEMRTLSVITRAMRSHLNLEALLKTIYVQVAHLLDVNNFTAALYDYDTRNLKFSLVMKQGEEQADWVDKNVNLEDTLVGYVVRTESPLLLPDDVYNRARKLGSKPPDSTINSWMGVPLSAGGSLLGVLVVTLHDPTRSFDQNDLRLLNIIAASSSIALENARLYKQETERAEQLVTLNRVISVLSETLSPDKVLDMIISSATAISKAHAVAVYLYWDDAHSTLPLVKSAGFSDQFLLESPDPLLAEYGDNPQQGQMTVAIENVATDKRTEDICELMERENKRAFIELPLLSGSEVLGVLVIYFESVQVFTGEKIELLKTYANQAAQAISNARKYKSTDEALQRSVEQLLTLGSIGRLLTSTVDLEEICTIILEQATNATNVDAGMVILHDELSRTTTLVSHKGYPEEKAKHFTIDALPIQRDVLRSGEIRRVDDIRQENAYESWRDSAKSLLCVPILRGKDTLGVVCLESDQIGGFGLDDNHFVSQIANQAVIAIDNARLFGRMAKDRDRLQVILESMEEGIMLINESAEVVLANPRIDLIGFKPTDLMGKSIQTLIQDTSLNLIERTGFRSSDEVLTLINNMRQRQHYTNHNYDFQGLHGELHLRRHILPVRNDYAEIIGLLLVFYNKTEEEELSRSREELSRMIVHDLRSPLTAVTTSLKLLRDLVPHGSEYRKIVDSTTDASRRAIRKVLNRVDALLDIAKMESGTIELETDLTEFGGIVKSVIDDLNPLAEELEVSLVSELKGDMLLLDVDPDKVERLVLNLVDNALKYTPRESHVYIRNSPPGTEGATEGFVRIEVVDEGPGIPDDYKDNLFERFVQIEGRRKVRRGVGLGLTFCRMVVNAHGGKIWVEDNPEGGSKFVFTLPVVNTMRFDEDIE